VRRVRLLVVLACLWLQGPLARAEDIVMARSALAFPEAMLALQEAIRSHGYTVSRVQRVDIGLTGMGYETDKYRIVFAGKRAQKRRPPSGTFRSGPIMTTSPSASGKPSTRISDMNLPICLAGKLTTAATWRPVSSSSR